MFYKLLSKFDFSKETLYAHIDNIRTISTWLSHSDNHLQQAECRTLIAVVFGFDDYPHMKQSGYSGTDLSLLEIGVSREEFKNVCLSLSSFLRKPSIAMSVSDDHSIGAYSFLKLTNEPHESDVQIMKRQWCDWANVLLDTIYSYFLETHRKFELFQSYALISAPCEYSDEIMLGKRDLNHPPQFLDMAIKNHILSQAYGSCRVADYEYILTPALHEYLLLNKDHYAAYAKSQKSRFIVDYDRATQVAKLDYDFGLYDYDKGVYIRTVDTVNDFFANSYVAKLNFVNKLAPAEHDYSFKLPEALERHIDSEFNINSFQYSPLTHRDFIYSCIIGSYLHNEMNILYDGSFSRTTAYESLFKGCRDRHLIHNITANSFDLLDEYTVRYVYRQDIEHYINGDGEHCKLYMEVSVNSNVSAPTHISVDDQGRLKIQTSKMKIRFSNMRHSAVEVKICSYNLYKQDINNHRVYPLNIGHLEDAQSFKSMMKQGLFEGGYKQKTQKDLLVPIYRKMKIISSPDSRYLKEFTTEN